MIPPPFSIQCLPKKYSQLGPNIAIALTVWWAKWLLLWLQGWELEEVDELWLLRSYDILQWKNIKMYTSITKYIGIRTHLWYWLTTSFRAPYLAYDFQTMNVYFFVCADTHGKKLCWAVVMFNRSDSSTLFMKKTCVGTLDFEFCFWNIKKVKKALLPKLSSLGVLKIATPCHLTQAMFTLVALAGEGEGIL